jgi:hypothetical protein
MGHAERILIALVCLLASPSAISAEKVPTPVASPRSGGGGKSVSIDVDARDERAVQPVVVRPVSPEEPGGSSSSLSPANQSQAGVGIQIRFGEDARKTPVEREVRRTREDGENVGDVK